MVDMNFDKAYLIGVVCGGGIVQGNHLKIKFPFRDWGKPSENPERAGQIARDMISLLRPLFKNEYGLEATYEVTKNCWYLDLYGDLSKIKTEMEEIGISFGGDIRSNFCVSGIIPLLTQDKLKRKFIAGLADTIGSTAKSHRRFTDDVQIVSLEINTFNFEEVMCLCQFLHDSGCIPDQVLWNHPTIHIGNNPYYKQWYKGMKIRIMIDQYLAQESFGFSSKIDSAQDNLQLQDHTNYAIPCPDKDCTFQLTSPHISINDKRLPECVRGFCFLHHKQLCAALGCKHAPYDRLDEQMLRIYDLISPFMILVKGKTTDISQIIEDDDLLSKVNYTESEKKFYEIYSETQTDAKLIYGSGNDDGYPTNVVLSAIDYLIAANLGQIKGNRTLGYREDRIKSILENDREHIFIVKKPSEIAPLIIQDNRYSVMIGPINKKLNGKVVSIDPNNKYLVKVRKPTLEEIQR